MKWLVCELRNGCPKNHAPAPVPAVIGVPLAPVRKVPSVESPGFSVNIAGPNWYDAMPFRGAWLSMTTVVRMCA